METTKYKIEKNQKFYLCRSPGEYPADKYKVNEDGIVVGKSEGTIFFSVNSILRIIETSRDPEYPRIIKCEITTARGRIHEQQFWIDTSILEDGSWDDDRREGNPLEEGRAVELLDSSAEIGFRLTDTIQGVRALMLKAIKILSDPATDTPSDQTDTRLIDRSKRSDRFPKSSAIIKKICQAVGRVLEIKSNKVEIRLNSKRTLLEWRTLYRGLAGGKDVYFHVKPRKRKDEKRLLTFEEFKDEARRETIEIQDEPLIRAINRLIQNS